MEEHKKARRRADAQRAPLADDRFRVVVDDGDRSSKLPPAPSGPGELSTPTPSSAAVVQSYSGASTVELPAPAPAPSPPMAPSPVRLGSESAEPVSLGAASVAARPAKSDEDRKLRGILLLAVAGFVVAAGGVFALRAVMAPPAVVETPTPAAVTGPGTEAPADTAPSAAASGEPTGDRILDLDTEDPGSSAEPSSTSRKRTRKPGSQPAAPTTGAAPTSPPPDGTSTKPGRRSPVIF